MIFDPGHEDAALEVVGGASNVFFFPQLGFALGVLTFDAIRIKEPFANVATFQWFPGALLPGSQVPRCPRLGSPGPWIWHWHCFSIALALLQHCFSIALALLEHWL